MAQETNIELPQLGTTEFVNMCETIFGGKSKENVERKSPASKEYQLWWELNQEKVLAQDRLRHEMNYKSALAKHIKKESHVK